MIERYNSANYPESGLVQNYCRNPYREDDLNKARTTWCLTGDDAGYWEECIPIGLLHPACKHGYSIEGESRREVVKYLGFVIWGLGVSFVS